MKRQLSIVFILSSEMMFVSPQWLQVYRRKNGTEFVKLLSDGRRVRVTLDDPNTVFITKRRTV